MAISIVAGDVHLVENPCIGIPLLEGHGMIDISVICHALLRLCTTLEYVLTWNMKRTLPPGQNEASRMIIQTKADSLIRGNVPSDYYWTDVGNLKSIDNKKDQDRRKRAVKKVMKDILDRYVEMVLFINECKKQGFVP